MKVVDVIRAALDPNDSALKVPTQSVSEQQIRMRISSLHGLKLWQSIVECARRASFHILNTVFLITLYRQMVHAQEFGEGCKRRTAGHVYPALDSR